MAITPPNTQRNAKPTIRIIHNLARSGGTLVSKCLGSMDTVALLSEIHPEAQKAVSFNAIKQAQQWLNFDPSYPWQGNGFISTIKMIHQHCANQQKTLLIRDWSHIDYLGVPVTNNPCNTPSLINSLKNDFEIQRIQLIRNPIDTWLSTRRLNLIKQANISSIDFVQAYLNYLEKTSASFQLLYENFLVDPSRILTQACHHLNIQYDDSYTTKWHTFNQITGDLSNQSSHRTKPEIKPRVRKTPEPEVIKEIIALQKHPAFEKILELVPEFNCYTM